MSIVYLVQIDSSISERGEGNKQVAADLYLFLYIFIFWIVADILFALQILSGIQITSNNDNDDVDDDVEFFYHMPLHCHL